MKSDTVNIFVHMTLTDIQNCGACGEYDKDSLQFIKDATLAELIHLIANNKIELNAIIEIRGADIFDEMKEVLPDYSTLSDIQKLSLIPLWKDTP